MTPAIQVCTLIFWGVIAFGVAGMGQIVRPNTSPWGRLLLAVAWPVAFFLVGAGIIGKTAFESIRGAIRHLKS